MCIDAKRVWPDTTLSSLDPYDQIRFPLPGNIGPAVHQQEFQPNMARSLPKTAIIQDPSHQQIQADIIKQFTLTAEALVGNLELILHCILHKLLLIHTLLIQCVMSFSLIARCTFRRIRRQIKPLM